MKNFGQATDFIDVANNILSFKDSELTNFKL